MKKIIISIFLACFIALFFACENGTNPNKDNTTNQNNENSTNQNNDNTTNSNNENDNTYIDDFDAAEWEKDVTTEIDEIKFSEGTWWFRERYFLTDDPIIQTGEFVITYNGTEMDLQYTKISQFYADDPSDILIFDSAKLKKENDFQYKIDSLDLEECDYTMPNGYAQKVQCFKNAGETKFKSHTVEHALGYSSGELEDIPSDRWFEKIQ